MRPPEPDGAGNGLNPAITAPGHEETDPEQAIRTRETGATGKNRGRPMCEQTHEGVLLKPAPVFKETKPEEVFGIVKWTGKPKTLEEMEAGILAEAARQYQGD